LKLHKPRRVLISARFYLLFITFSVVAGSIDTLTATTNQGIVKYGYSQSIAGFVLAALIGVGVISAIIVSPVLDKTKRHSLGLKIFMTAIALSFTALPFVPQTKSVPALFIVFGAVGASVLAIEPCVLEVQASWTHPVSPELSSFVCWSGAKILAAVFTILVGNVLVLDEPKYGQPKGSLFVGQLFIAAMAWLCVPCTMVLGYWVFKKPAASQVRGN
jgi:MFS transporter, FLVCR family, MFS-domain-containing protein 7